MAKKKPKELAVTSEEAPAEPPALPKKSRRPALTPERVSACALISRGNLRHNP